LGCLLDVHPAGLCKEDHRLFFCPVDRDAHVIFVLDIEPLFDEHPLDRHSLNCGAEELAGGLDNRIAVGHQDTAGLSPPPDIHLCLDDDVSGDLVHMEEDLLVLACKDTFGYPDPFLCKELFSLVFQQFHDDFSPPARAIPSSMALVLSASVPFGTESRIAFLSASSLTT